MNNLSESYYADVQCKSQEWRIESAFPHLFVPLSLAFCGHCGHSNHLQEPQQEYKLRPTFHMSKYIKDINIYKVINPATAMASPAFSAWSCFSGPTQGSHTLVVAQICGKQGKEGLTQVSWAVTGPILTWNRTDPDHLSA